MGRYDGANGRGTELPSFRLLDRAMVMWTVNMCVPPQPERTQLGSWVIQPSALTGSITTAEAALKHQRVLLSSHIFFFPGGW